MLKNYAELMFTQAVQDLQKADGMHAQFQASYPERTKAEFSQAEIDFLQSCRSFYIATINEDGWPYVQHRGGPAGFLQVVETNKLACADFPGNRQFITMGNLKDDAKVSLFFMDYANSARLKIQGTARLNATDDVDPDLVAKVTVTGNPASIRVLEIDVVALDWNCPKYIPKLYPESFIQQVIGPKIQALSQENEDLKTELANLKAQLDLK